MSGEQGCEHGVVDFPHGHDLNRTPGEPIDLNRSSSDPDPAYHQLWNNQYYVLIDYDSDEVMEGDSFGSTVDEVEVGG